MDKDTSDAVSATETVRRIQFHRRQMAMLFSVVVMLLLFSVFAVIFAGDLARVSVDNYYDSSSYGRRVEQATTTIRILALVAIIAALGMATYLFMTGFSFANLNRSSALIESRSGIEIVEFAKIADSLQIAANTIQENRFVTDGDKQFIGERLEKIIKDALPSEFLAKIEEQYGDSIRNEKVSTFSEETLRETRKRLSEFQIDLSRKASGALTWGMVVAAVGLVLLAAFIFGSTYASGL
jgi:hypothetical protein